MEKIRTIIVEDEMASLYVLKEELDPFDNLDLIGEYRNGVDGLAGINSQNPDLVFVDIQMPELDGFQMLNQLTCSPAVIFCTGHKKYALEAWDYRAADFLTKPIDPQRLKQALERALDDIKNKRQEERIRNQKIFGGLIELTWIDQNGKKSRFFSPDEISYIQADRDYQQIYLAPESADDQIPGERMIILKKTMKETTKEWEQHGFIQIHKSFLINFSKVTEWDKSARKIHLQHVSEPLPIGRSFIKQFQEKWLDQKLN